MGILVSWLAPNRLAEEVDRSECYEWLRATFQQYAIMQIRLQIAIAI